MSATKMLPVLFLLMSLFSANGKTESSHIKPALPLKIRNYLHKNYAGWKLVSIADGCSSEFKGAFASGDFDGDGKRDYVVKFTKGEKGYIMAFLNRKYGYESHVLHGNMSVEELKNTGISVFRKGKRVPVGDPQREDSYQHLTNDAPFDGPCESDAGGVHIYRNGKFN